MGGAPKQLQNLKQCKSNQEERVAAIAMDSALRHESVRASRLADELRKHSSSKDIPRALPRKFHPPTCTYSGVSTRYKELLMQRSSLSALSPLQIHCYCSHCAAGKPLVSVSGTPPHQYTLPVGWCQFLLRYYKKHFIMKSKVPNQNRPKTGIVPQSVTNSITSIQQSSISITMYYIFCLCRKWLV